MGWGCRLSNWRRHGIVCHLIEVIDDTLLHHGIRLARVSLKYMPGLEHRVLYVRCALACLAHDVGMVTDGDRHERRLHTLTTQALRLGVRRCVSSRACNSSGVRVAQTNFFEEESVSKRLINTSVGVLVDFHYSLLAFQHSDVSAIRSMYDALCWATLKLLPRRALSRYSPWCECVCVNVNVCLCDF